MTDALRHIRYCTHHPATGPSRRMLGIPALKWLLLVGILALLPLMPSVQAQETAESRAFKTASRFFQTGIYETAERQFQTFAAQFPQSPMLAEAVLLQARSAIALTNHGRAISILTTNMGRAGLLGDQYRFRLAEAQMAVGEFALAAETYALLLRQFPNSQLSLEAAYGEALARFKRRDFARTTTLLQDPNGTFQQSARVRTSDRFTTSGLLLLAEALFEQKRFAEAIEVLRPLGIDGGKAEYPEYDWERQHLLCRIQLAMQKLPEALAQSSNLVAAARITATPTLLADSFALQASVLRQLDRIEDAINVYTNNYAASVPEDRRRLAVMNVIELKLALGRTTEAGQMLQEILGQRREDLASDVALLTSGELQLRIHLDTTKVASTNPPTTGIATNRLIAAIALFDQVGTNSSLRGKALLNKGWCLWLEKRISESIPVLRAAIDALPFSEDLAIARFKLADAYFVQADYTNALASYRAVTNDFAGIPRVRTSLFDQALHQIVRVHIHLGAVEEASATMQQLLDAYPKSLYSARSLWLVGQELADAGAPARAREIFSEFSQRFPERPLRPRVDLALAETHLREGNFTDAIDAHAVWLGRHPTNEFRPRAEFNLAWANARAGRTSNAITLFTNFVVRFPTNELAREAQFWVAEEYFRQGDYPAAQRGFQLIAENTNWIRGRLTFQARMMAGRAAFSAQLWKDAGDHFTRLIEDAENCPVEIQAEAYYALGDTITRDDAGLRQSNPARRPTEKFADARTAFERLTTFSQFATNRLIAHLMPLAWGRIGDCCLQLATEDPKQYDNATNAYFQAMQHPAADASARSLAEFGLAHVFEIRAQEPDLAPETRSLFLKQAFEHYFNLVLGGNLTDRDSLDPAWVERGGFAAARLAEAQGQWPLAMTVYRTMHEMLEPLRARLDEKIRRAAEQMRGEKTL